MQNLSELKSFLQTPQNIVITTHHKPDADALGSSLGWAGYLKKLGHSVQVITPSDYPKFLHWMPGNTEVIAFNAQNEPKIRQFVKNATLICCLDFSGYGRLEKMAAIFAEAKAPVLLLDHHIDPTIEAKFDLWDVHAAATAELVYRLIVMLGDKNKIDEPIGNCIYAGILTDTASFKHPTTSKAVHEIAGDLIDIGVDTSHIHHLIYDSSTEERLRFLGYALSEKLKILYEYKTAYFAITAQELKKFNSQTGDTEGVVNYALGIEDIVLAAIFIDRGDGVKISFRSIGDFSVNELSHDNFNGGGHKNAAGGSSTESLEKTVQRFLSLLPQYKEKLLATH
jgi:bifunctional oligoribonuclease and PAP phosphatase NrnA